MTSSIEKDAAVVGKIADKNKEMGTNPEYKPGTALRNYGIDYFEGTSAKKHAERLDTKTKALEDVRRLYSENGIRDPTITLDVTEKDIEAYQAFQDLEYLRDFEHYAGEKFLKEANPAQVKWFYDVYPELFQRRIDELDKVLNVQKKFAILMITGPRTKEDLLFMYEIDMMKTKNPTKFSTIFEKPVSLGVGQQKDTYSRGILSLKEVFSKGPTIAERDQGGNSLFPSNTTGFQRGKYAY